MNKRLDQYIGYDLRFLEKLSANYGPHFTWWAIRNCIRDKREFPEWVRAYLGRCANRVLSGKAKRARKAKRISDPRKRLVEIFEFPEKKKPGPGGPSEELHRAVFAMDFALRVLFGEEDKPKKARVNAGDEVFGEGNVDDRQLQRFLREQFQLKKNVPMPETKKEWEPVFDRHLTAIGDLLYGHLEKVEFTIVDL
jgi:hypothetical protein